MRSALRACSALVEWESGIRQPNRTHIAKDACSPAIKHHLALLGSSELATVEDSPAGALVRLAVAFPGTGWILRIHHDLLGMFWIAFYLL